MIEIVCRLIVLFYTVMFVAVYIWAFDRKPTWRSPL